MVSVSAMKKQSPYEARWVHWLHLCVSHSIRYCSHSVRVLLMASGGPAETSAPWQKNVDSETINVKVPADLIANTRDLRCLDMEGEKQNGTYPRGTVEACFRSSESDTASEEDDAPQLEGCCSNSRATCHWRKFFKLWKRKSVRRLASFPPAGVFKMSKIVNRIPKENPVLSDLYNFKSSLVNFSLAELQTATNNFSHENLIGRGGYAEVYKGRLQNGQLIAVKRLTERAMGEKIAGFLSELGIIAHVDHPNTAKLVGCGIDGGMFLVLKLTPNGSLGSILHGSQGNRLDWGKRYKIALGAADGLLYLHENCQRRIIHRDIKADNILLTEDFEPQICDFGLAKWLPKQWTHYSVSKFEGTFGYFAPEYFLHGIVDEKTDVYSFGVLLLELITGRRALDQQQSLVVWAKPLLNQSLLKELVDPSIGKSYDLEEVARVALTASLCIEQSPILRPRMSQVVVLLRGNEYVSESALERPRRSLQGTYSEELLHAQEYEKTKYLSDLQRHKQVALGL